MIIKMFEQGLEMSSPPTTSIWLKPTSKQTLAHQLEALADIRSGVKHIVNLSEYSSLKCLMWFPIFLDFEGFNTGVALYHLGRMRASLEYAAEVFFTASIYIYMPPRWT